MRKILIAATLAAAVCATTDSAAFAQANPSVNFADPAMQTRAGRASICRQRLQARGYPESYVRTRPGRGMVASCARGLWLASRRQRA